MLVHLNGGRQGGPQQFERFLGDDSDIHRFSLLLPLAAEDQNLVDQILRPLAGLHHLLQVTALDIRSVLIQHGQFGIADHGGENIIEIMGNAAGQGADGLHFLGLPELRLQTLTAP